MKHGSFAAFCVSVMLAAGVPAHAADETATLHYNDLYNIQQQIAGLQDLKQLRVNMFVISMLPGVAPKDIKMIIHRASGELTGIPIDDEGRITLPVSADIEKENPQITTNQPRHSLNASVLIDLVPLTSTEMGYADLMLGTKQFNEAIDRGGAMAPMLGPKDTGLLLFYNSGSHTLTIHQPGGDKVLKSESLSAAKKHLKDLKTTELIKSTTVIYVPMDGNLFKQNPKVSLDALPDQAFPAI